MRNRLSSPSSSHKICFVVFGCVVCALGVLCVRLRSFVVCLCSKRKLSEEEGGDGGSSKRSKMEAVEVIEL